MTLTRLLKSSGMESTIKNYMDDAGYFEEADKYFDKDDYTSARRTLENGLFNAIQYYGGDYTYNFDKIRAAVGNLINW